jgi:aspartyl-tRNA(Asn)/glutamyl-tRNA(Gln) amidotransferase subunit C
MSGLSASEIDHLAKLARLALSDAEKEKFSLELPKIAEFVEALQKSEVITDSQKNAVRLEMLRDDVPGNSGLNLDQLKQLSPQWEKGQNVVPPVFGGGDNA